MKYYLKAFKKYAVFSGRASRSEFWFFYLFNMVAVFIIGFISGIIGALLGANTDSSMWQVTLYVVVALIPTWAVMVRRLHDVGRSGWWAVVPFSVYLVGLAIMLLVRAALGAGLLIMMVAFVLQLGLIATLIIDSQPGSNRFGQNPKGVNPVLSEAPATRLTT